MSKAEFLAGSRIARVEREEILARLDPKTLDETAVPGLSWRTKELLAHLIGYDLAVLKAIGDVRAGREWAWGWASSNFDDWNESQVLPRRSRTYATVRAELDQSRTRLVEELERWHEDAGPFGPDTWDPGRSEIGWIGPHEREHAETVAAL